MYGSMYNSECCCRYSVAEPTIAYANLKLIKPSVRVFTASSTSVFQGFSCEVSRLRRNKAWLHSIYSAPSQSKNIATYPVCFKHRILQLSRVSTKVATSNVVDVVEFRTDHNDA